MLLISIVPSFILPSSILLYDTNESINHIKDTQGFFQVSVTMNQAVIKDPHTGVCVNIGFNSSYVIT